MPLSDLLSTPCDVLIPAAIPDVIDADVARTLSCRIVVEAANGPTTEEGDTALRDRGIVVLPDIIANGGPAVLPAHACMQQCYTMLSCCSCSASAAHASTAALPGHIVDPGATGHAA